MSRSIRGFGGVVFGNTVQGPSEITKVSSVRFEQADKNVRGLLRFSLGDGRQAVLREVDGEVANAARNILFSPVHGLDVPANDEGIGMVGIKDNLVTVLPTDTPEKFIVASRFNVVLHPALVNTDLGWCILSIDALPIISKRITEEVRRTAGDAAARTFEQLWSMRHGGTWKVVDVAMEISLSSENGELTLNIRRGSEFGTAYPLGLRSRSFLEMRPITEESAEDIAAKRGESTRLRSRTDGDNIDTEFASAFYQASPLLFASSRDYAGANDLARVMGALRWAKSLGANFSEGNLPKPAERLTPAAIILREDKGVEPAETYKIDLAAYTASHESAKKALAQLEAGSDLVRQAAAINKGIADLQTEAIEKLKPLQAELKKAIEASNTMAILTAGEAIEKGSEKIAGQMEGRFTPLLEQERALRNSPENRNKLASYDRVYAASEELGRQVGFFKENPKELKELTDESAEISGAVIPQYAYWIGIPAVLIVGVFVIRRTRSLTRERTT